MTDAGTKRALYCDELRIGAGRKRKAAMQGSRNHFGQLGRLAVCAMGRSDSAWVHGGEHGSGLLLGGAALGGLVKPNELHGQSIARLCSLARRKLADEALCDAHALSDLRLRHPGLRQVGDEVLPVHAPIIAFAIIGVNRDRDRYARSLSKT